MNMKNTSLLRALICLGTLHAGAYSLSAAIIGTYNVNAEFNTAGCPYTGNPADRNPFACPTQLPPGPYVIDLPAADYAITLTGGVPGNDYIWDGNASSGVSIAAPQVLGTTVTFTHTAGQIALYWYDWVPFDNDPSLFAIFRISTVTQAPETSTWSLVATGLIACLAGYRRR